MDISCSRPTCCRRLQETSEVFFPAQTFHNSGISRRAKHAEKECDTIFFNQSANVFHRLGWAEAVIVADEIDLMAVNASRLGHHLEERALQVPHRAVGRRGAAVRNGVADPDLIRGDARRFRMGAPELPCHRHRDGRAERGSSADRCPHWSDVRFVASLSEPNRPIVK